MSAPTTIASTSMLLMFAACAISHQQPAAARQPQLLSIRVAGFVEAAGIT